MTEAAPDYEAAKEYALDRLANELPADLVYHSLEHTVQDVVPAVTRLATIEDVQGENYLLLQTAAYFHDIGFVERRNEHEEVAARIARAVLPQLGFNPDQIERICGMIMATRLPQSPQDHLEAIMADGDLDVLGRPDFWEKNHALRQELLSNGLTMTDKEWYQEQINFLQEHSYFTPAARMMREEQKAKNIALLIEKLQQC